MLSLCIKRFRFRSAIIATLIATSLVLPQSAMGQESTRTQADEEVTSDGPRFEDLEIATWEVGLKIESVGHAQGISASVPIPFEWPEQLILSEIEIKPAGVNNIRYSRPTRDSRLMGFQINQMSPGETIETVVRYQIRKQRVIAPPDTSRFCLPATSSRLTDFLKPSPYIESRHKRIVEIANQLHDESLPAWDQVETIYRWVRDNIEYKFDEQIHTCLEALDAKHGDCEELSSLFIAICRALKIPARAVLIPGHTYPEFYLEDENGHGYWFPCQLAGEYEFGGMTELKPVIHKGDRFKIAGVSGMQRYLQATLMERSGQGQLKIEWITRKIEPKSNEAK